MGRSLNIRRHCRTLGVKVLSYTYFGVTLHDRSPRAAPDIPILPVSGMYIYISKLTISNFLCWNAMVEGVNSEHCLHIFFSRHSATLSILLSVLAIKSSTHAALSPLLSLFLSLSLSTLSSGDRDAWWKTNNASVARTIESSEERRAYLKRHCSTISGLA